MKRFAYIRCSSDIQSTLHQKNAILESGYTPDEWFSEDGVSGTVLAADRPVFKAMMEIASEGDEVLVVAVDRLGRNAADILKTVETFVQRKIKLRIKAFDNVDVTSPYGKMFISMLAVFAELDRAQIIERLKSGNSRKKSEGVIMGRAFSIEPSLLRSMEADKLEGMTLDRLSDKYKADRGTIGRNLKQWSGKIDEYELAFNTRKEQEEARRQLKLLKLQN